MCPLAEKEVQAPGWALRAHMENALHLELCIRKWCHPRWQLWSSVTAQLWILDQSQYPFLHLWQVSSTLPLLCIRPLSLTDREPRSRLLLHAGRLESPAFPGSSTCKPHDHCGEDSKSREKVGGKGSWLPAHVDPLEMKRWKWFATSLFLLLLSLTRCSELGEWIDFGEKDAKVSQGLERWGSGDLEKESPGTWQDMPWVNSRWVNLGKLWTLLSASNSLSQGSRVPRSCSLSFSHPLLANALPFFF